MAGFAWNYTTWLHIPAMLLAGWFVLSPPERRR
jgi:hypothetical protein